MEIRKNYGTKGVYFMENIISAAKTDVFRVRINPEIKQELESVYAKNGLTLTDAINVFFQQSLNAGGFQKLSRQRHSPGWQSSCRKRRTTRFLTPRMKCIRCSELRNEGKL